MKMHTGLRTSQHKKQPHHNQKTKPSWREGFVFFYSAYLTAFGGE